MDADKYAGLFADMVANKHKNRHDIADQHNITGVYDNYYGDVYIVADTKFNTNSSSTTNSHCSIPSYTNSDRRTNTNSSAANSSSTDSNSKLYRDTDRNILANADSYMVCTYGDMDAYPSAQPDSHMHSGFIHPQPRSITWLSGAGAECDSHISIRRRKQRLQTLLFRSSFKPVCRAGGRNHD